MNIEDAPSVLTGDTSIADFKGYPNTGANPVREMEARTWNSVSGLFILAVCIWSLSQTWIELDAASPSLGAMCAVVVAKLIWVGAGILALSGKRGWRGVFAFLCCASVLAVGSALPSIFPMSKTLFFLLLMECVLKTLCLVALLCDRAASAH